MTDTSDDQRALGCTGVVMPCPFCGAADCEVLLDHVECRVCSAQGPYSSYSDGDPEDFGPPSGRREKIYHPETG